MITKAVGTLMSRTAVAATTNRTIGRLAASTSTIAPPYRLTTTTSGTNSASRIGRPRKITLPVIVSRLHVRPTAAVTAPALDGQCRRCRLRTLAHDLGPMARGSVASSLGGRMATRRRGCQDPLAGAWATTRPRRPSFVDSAHDRIQRRHDRHRVRDQIARHDQADRLEVHEAGVVDPHPERLVRAVADGIRGVLAAWAFDRRIGPAWSRPEQPRQLGHDRTVGHLVEALVDDPDALPDLVHPQQVASQAVALGAGDDVEVELRIDRVGMGPPEVERQAARPQVGAGEAHPQGGLAVDRAEA